MAGDGYRIIEKGVDGLELSMDKLLIDLDTPE
jgi:hypothetical protein